LGNFLEFFLKFALEHGRIDAQFLQQILRKPLPLPEQSQREMLDIDTLMSGAFGQFLGFGEGFLGLDGQTVKSDDNSPFSAFTRPPDYGIRRSEKKSNGLMIFS